MSTIVGDKEAAQSAGTPSVAPDLMALLTDPTQAGVPVHSAPALRGGALLAVADAVFMIAGACVAALVAPAEAADFDAGTALGLGTMAALLAAALGAALPRMPGRLGTGPGTLRAAFGAALAIAATGIDCWLAFRAGPCAPPALLLWLLTWAALAIAPIVVIHLLLHRGAAPRVLLLGRTDSTLALSRDLGAGEAERWRLVGRIDDLAPDALERIAALVARRAVDLVILVAGSAVPTQRCAKLCDRLADQPVRICLALPNSVLGATGLRHSSCFTLLDLHDTPQAGGAAAAKRCFDLLGCLLLLLLLGPVMLTIAAAIRLETPGPALFRQWRFGLGSQPFEVLKFRTMHLQQCDPTGAQRTLRRDPRVTRIGRILRRTSLDELPQLLNVLRGEMSLIGPRPHPLHMRVGNAYFFDAVDRYLSRHLVKPGISGWAQVNGSRGEVDTLPKAERRLELDLWYIRHWSFGLDLRILLRTVLGRFVSPGAD